MTAAHFILAFSIILHSTNANPPVLSNSADLRLYFTEITWKDEVAAATPRSISAQEIDQAHGPEIDVWPKIPLILTPSLEQEWLGQESEKLFSRTNDGNGTFTDHYGNRYQLSERYEHRYRYQPMRSSSKVLKRIPISSQSQKTRSRRQLPMVQSGVQSGLEAANILINAETSNVTVTQLINITSGRSIVDIRQDPVRVRVLSELSNVRIDPRDYYVNVSVKSPFVLANVSDRILLSLVSNYSDAYVNAQPSSQQVPNLLIQSGPSNLTVRTGGGARIEALAERSSQVAVRIGQQLNADQQIDEIWIDSRLLSAEAGGGNLERELMLSALSATARMDVQLIHAYLWIKYNMIELQVSSKDHEILVYTGVYTVTIKTLLSPFRIRVTSTVSVEIDNATISVDPNNSNVTGHIPNSLLLIRPDNATRVQIVANDQQSALDNSAIDVESRDLNLQILSSTRRIWAESILSNALITSRYTTVGLRANRSYIEVLAGNPYMRALTGNTSVEIRSSGGPLTLPSGSGLAAGALVGQPPTYQTVNPPFVFSVGPGGIIPIQPFSPPGFPLVISTSAGRQTGEIGPGISFPTPPPFPGGNSTSGNLNTERTSASPLSVSSSSTSISTTGVSLSDTGIGISTSNTGSNRSSSLPSVPVTTARSIFTQTSATESAGSSLTTSTTSFSASPLSVSSSGTENPSSSTISTINPGASSSSSTLITASVSETQLTSSRTIVSSSTVSGSTGTATVSGSAPTTQSIFPNTGFMFSATASNTGESSASSDGIWHIIRHTGTAAFAVSTRSSVSGTSTTSSSTASISEQSSIGSQSLISQGSTFSSSISFPPPVSIPPPIPNETLVSLSSSTSTISTSSSLSVSLSSGKESSSSSPSSAQTPIVITSGTSSSGGTVTTTSSQIGSATESSISRSLTSSGASVESSTSPLGASVPPMNMSQSPAPSPSNASGLTDFVIGQFSVVSSQSQLSSTTFASTALDTGASSPSGPAFEALTFNGSSLESPVNKEYLLSVAVKVRRSSDSYTTEFLRTIKEGLTQAYIEGKDRQLGVQEQKDQIKSDIRKRSAEEDLVASNSSGWSTVGMATTLATVRQTLSPLVPGLYQVQRKHLADVKLTSIDRRNPDETKVRFYIVSDDRLVEAKKAKDTFDQLSIADLSSFLTYPVVQPIQPYIADDGSEYSSQTGVQESRVIMAVLVAVGALLLVSLTLAAFCYWYKRKQKSAQQKAAAVGTTSRQKPEDVESGVSRSDSANNAQSKSPSLGAKNDKDALSKKVHLAELPLLKTKSGQLIRELSARDLEDYDGHCFPTHPTKACGSIGAHVNKVKPLPSSIVRMDASVPGPASAQVMPWKTQQQVVTLSPTGRRRLARKLLDTAFPLANVNIDHILRQTSTAHSRVPGEALPVFDNHFYSRRL